MRCKACDAEMSEIRNRNVMDEMGTLHVLMEDLCPRCIVASKIQFYDMLYSTKEELHEIIKGFRPG